MQDVVPIRSRAGHVLTRSLDYLPRGNTLDDKAWHRRHRMLQWVLLLHIPGLVGLGLLLGDSLAAIGEAITPPVICLVVGRLVAHRRWASFFVTGGLVFCSSALVLLSHGSIEAHFHFFIIIGFIALYQDWVPFLWNVVFTVLSHGVGTIWLGGQIFNHPAAQAHPWLWSFIHGVAVLFACIGMVIFWRVTEDEQTQKEALGRQLLTADAEINRQQFTSEMLVNLARRNQSMLYRQLDIINHLEDKERDPDALADLFKLDHLATRVRRNAENLLVLAGEQTPRTWSAPVALRDVVRAAIAETEDLDRVVFAVDDQVSVHGASVADLTHLLAELTENAVRFSPPETAVTIRARPNRRDEGGQLLTVEDWGVGMPPDDLAEANAQLAQPREVDLAVSQRLGFHVVARLAARHGISVSLSTTPGSGITAVAILPAALFTRTAADGAPAPAVAAPAVGRVDRPAAISGRGGRADALPMIENGATRTGPGPAVTRNGGAWLPPEPFSTAPAGDGGPTGPEGRWRGWWNPDVHGLDAAAPAGGPALTENGGDTANGDTAHPGNGYRSWHSGNGHNGNGSSNGNGHHGNGSSNGNGHDGNGHNGHNGHNGNGHGNGHHGATRDGVDRRPIAAPGEPVGTRAAASGPGQDAGAEPEPRTRAVPGRPVFGRVGADMRETQAPEPQSVGGGVGDAPGVPRPAGPRDPASRSERPDVPDARYELRGRTEQRPPTGGDGAGSRPGPTRSPGPSLPQPRADEPGMAELRAGRPASPSPGGRGLRRRVPQSHLAPELREAGNGGLAETAAPLSADAAASALSRYQASRLAAQAVVDTPGESRQTEQGERA